MAAIFQSIFSFPPAQPREKIKKNTAHSAPQPSRSALPSADPKPYPPPELAAGELVRLHDRTTLLHPSEERQWPDDDFLCAYRADYGSTLPAPTWGGAAIRSISATTHRLPASKHEASP